jgi:hypothetical protein
MSYSAISDTATVPCSLDSRATRNPAAGLEALLAEVTQVQALVADLPDRDVRPPEEILGYDERGLPG